MDRLPILRLAMAPATWLDIDLSQSRVHKVSSFPQQDSLHDSPESSGSPAPAHLDHPPAQADHIDHSLGFPVVHWDNLWQ